MEQNKNPMPEIKISALDIFKAVGDIALSAFTMLPRRVLSPVSDHFQSGVITRGSIPFEEPTGECDGQMELGLED